MSDAAARPLALGTNALPVAAAVAVTLAALLLIYRDTFASLVSVWQQSETFAHCFLIAPLCAYLIWRRRHELGQAPKQVSALGLAAVAVLSAGWFVAASADVQVGQHLTAVMLIPAATLALLGVQATRTIAFPLAYLLFAVPFGESLIPWLMDFTATFTVAALRLTGLPVLREGLYFTIPSGDFEVAKACSGIRYLIACLALGVLYAHFSYRSLAKRAIFIAVCIVAPIVANGVRAYLIVLLAHASDMRLAVGVDHLIYGWLFFGLLVALLFWIGGRYADPPGDDARVTVTQRPAAQGRRVALAGAAVVAIAVAGAAPYLQAANAERAAQAPPRAGLPVLAASWRGPEPDAAAWRRAAPAGARETGGRYVGPRATADVAILRFGHGPADAEMVGATAGLVEAARVLDTGRATAKLDGEQSVNEIMLRADRGFRVVWSWYEIDGTLVAEDWRAKLREALGVVLRGRVDAALVVASVEAPDPELARELLRDFLAEAWPGIARCVDAAAAECVEGWR